MMTDVLYLVDPARFQAAIRDGRMSKAAALLDVDEPGAPFEVVGGTAVIPVRGVMVRRASPAAERYGLASMERIENAVRAAAADSAIDRIVLRIDSPGGSAIGTAELGTAIREARESKPITAVIDGFGASAAYWIASQADEISLNPSGMAGSIGTYMVVEDWSRAFESAGIVTHVISTGPLKGAGVWGAEVTDEQIAAWQAEVDSLNELFLGAVAGGRGMDPDKVRGLADGGMHVGEQAVRLGLVDRIETFRAAMQRLGGAGGVAGRNPFKASGDAGSGDGHMERDSKVADMDAVADGADATPADATAKDAAAAPSVPSGTDAEQLAAEREYARQEGIRELAAQHDLGDQWAARHCRNRTSLDEARKLAAELKDFRESAQPIANVAGGEDLNLQSIGDGFRDALLMRAGAPVESPSDRSREFLGGNTLSAISRFFDGLGLRTSHMTQAQLASLAMNPQERWRMLASAGVSAAAAPHATADFDSILRDAVNKRLRDAYTEFAPTWSVWCRENASIPDFKTVRVTQLSAAPTPTIVREGAEYQYATVSDGEETYTLAKYGKIISLTWEALINDDLGAFNRLPSMHGAAATRLEDDLVYDILTTNGNMADGNALFSAAHSNIETSGGAPTVDTLAAGRAAMRTQTGLQGEQLNIAPAFLIVPAALETTAEQLINSTVDPSLANAGVNPFSGRLRVVVNSRLDAANAAGWYLAASPASIDTIEVGFLSGYRQPQVEEEMSFNTDARHYKVRHTVGVKAIDWRGLYYNDGAT